MSKAKRIVIITALSLIALGILITAAASVYIGSDYSQLDTNDIKTRSEVLTEPFEKIDINCIDSSIYVLPSSDGSCRIIFSDTEKTPHTFEIANGKLTVKQTDSRKWYDFINISWSYEEIGVTLYLPEATYKELYIKTVSGDIELPDGFEFADTTLLSTSGDIECNADISGELTARSTSGDLEISGAIENSAVITSTSGDIELKDMTADDLTAKSTSGNVELDRVTVAGECLLKTTSGDVLFDHCDAASFDLKSTSGDIKGDILSPKNFSADTVSGDVSVPNSDTSAGECVVKTTSGDIRIRILE